MADFKITMKEEIERLARNIDGFRTKQLPFAKARALWFTALETKKNLPAEMNRVFTIRRNKKNPWPVKQMRIVPESMSAIKKAGANEVTIGTKDPLGAMLTLGGTRFRKDGKPLAIPILGGARKNKQTIIRQGRNDLATVMAKPNAFVIRPKNRPGQTLVVLRRKKFAKGESENVGKRYNAITPLTLMFSLKQQANIRPMWRLDTVLQHALQTLLPNKFVEACHFAMRSAK